MATIQDMQRINTQMEYAHQTSTATEAVITLALNHPIIALGLAGSAAIAAGIVNGYAIPILAVGAGLVALVLALTAGRYFYKKRQVSKLQKEKEIAAATRIQKYYRDYYLKIREPRTQLRQLKEKALKRTVFEAFRKLIK